jgi:hypothetical protein
MKLIDVTPTTDIIHSMRRAGYKWHEAVLDIVDNAVDALKTQHDKTGSPTGLVTIKYLMKDKKVTGIVIADNATGIDEATLQKIMKMGWSAKRGTDQLGTFGMGLKTAGISLGDLIRVVSTTSDSSALRMVRWDVDQILKSRKFKAKYYDGDVPEEVRKMYLSHVGDCSGTMVVIENLLDIVPKSRGAITQTLIAKCTLNYRHMLNPLSPSGYYFPFAIKVIGRKNNLEADFDPLLWDSAGTKELIGSKTVARGYEWGNFKFEVRLVHHRPESCTTRRDEQTLGAGIRSRSGIYFVRGGRTISAGHYSLLKYSSAVSNVYGEIFFTDSGMRDSSSPIQMDFGKKGVILDADFEKWMKKHIFKPYVKKIAAEQKEEAKKAKKSDRSKVLDHVSTLNLPADVLGREKADAATKAANIFSAGAPKTKTSATAKRKYRGTNVKVGNQETSIKVEEVSWKGSDLPFIANMEAGNPTVVVQLNVEHPWVEKNIYLSNNPERVEIAVQLAAANALSVVHEEDEVQDEILKKQGNLLNILGDHFGELFSAGVALDDSGDELEPLLIEEASLYSA